MSDLTALHRKVDALSHAFLHVARYLIRRESNMSAATDAIKADLTTLEADIDTLAASTSEAAAAALAAEEADVAEIRTRLETIGSKVHGLAAAFTSPSASTPPTAAVGAETDPAP